MSKLQLSLCALSFLGFAVPAVAVNPPITTVQYTITPVPLPSGALTIIPTGLNNNGQAVGQVFDGGYYSFFFNGTTTTTTHLAGGIYAMGINDSSTICGYYSSGGVTYPYIQQGSTVTQIAPWNPQGTWIGGINNAGQIAGEGTDLTTQSSRALIYTAGSYKNLGTVGGSLTSSSAVSINSFGDVAGAWDANSSGPDKAMIYTDGAMHVFSGSIAAIAQGINDSRQVVGREEAGSGKGFFYDYSSNKYTTVAPPTGFTASSLAAINNAGTAVGWCSTQSLIDAAVYSPGQGMTDLNQLIDPSSGWSLYKAYAINNSGQILTLGYHRGGSGTEPLILTPVPVPEPASAALLAIACASLLARNRSHRLHHHH